VARSAVHKLNLGLSLRFQPDMSGIARGARDAKGRFTSMQTLVKQANEEMALEVANYMVKSLEESVKDRGRTQRGTELLARAILNEENRDASIDGFVVGTDYMDRSPAKMYWRGVEEGSSKHVGRLIYGWFADEVPSEPASRYRPSEARRTNARMIQLPHPPQASGPQFTSTPGYERVGGPFWFRIKNPIPAYHYMREGAADWMSTGSAAATYRKVFASAGITMT
jgi:hypothetical protein